MNRRIRVSLFFFIVTMPVFSLGHEISAVGLFSLRPLFTEAVYGNGVGGGILYRSPSLLKAVPLSVGAQLDAVLFGPTNNDFGLTFMIRPGVTAEIPLEIPLSSDWSMVMGPYLGYRHYFNRHEYKKKGYLSIRPTAVLGMRFDVLTPFGMIFGAGVEYSMLFESELRHSFALGIKAGLVLEAAGGEGGI